MLVKTPYNYDGDVESFRTGLDCSDAPTRAQQHFRDETDINVLVARFARTGVPDAPPVAPPVDFDDVFDFQSAMQRIIDARAAFGALPAKVRARFSNDPGQFLAFVGEDSNRDEAIALGLVPRPVEVPLDSPIDAPPASDA